MSVTVAFSVNQKTVDSIFIPCYSTIHQTVHRVFVHCNRSKVDDISIPWYFAVNQAVDSIFIPRHCAVRRTIVLCSKSSC